VCVFVVSFHPKYVDASAARFGIIYAPGTRQNHPDQPGVFRYWLDRQLDTRRYPDGNYQIEVEARDVRGNSGRRQLPVTIDNARPPV